MKYRKIIEDRFLQNWGKNFLEPSESEYLNNYLLSESLLQSCEKQMLSIFKNPVDYPEKVFLDVYDVKIFTGGVLFIEEEFSLLKKCSEKINDQWIFIVEDVPAGNKDRLFFRFPVEIKWDKLIDGGMLSFELFCRPIRNYFVFGDTGLWGKYAGNDYEDPKDILGFKEKIAEIFSIYDIRITD